jgi:hypothetical protein
VTPFVGFGSTRATLASAATVGPPATAADTGKTITTDEIPLGVSAGWRTSLGATRALALSVAPAYTIYRRSGGALDGSRGALRVATVGEIAVTSRIGVTLGAEFGQSAGAAEPGPTGTRVGLGASFVLRGR